MGEQFKIGDRVQRLRDLPPEVMTGSGFGYAGDLPLNEVFVVEKVAADGHLVLEGRNDELYEKHYYPEHVQLVKAPVGQLARFNGETWDPIEEQTLDVPDDGWWHLGVQELELGGRYLDRDAFAALGLEVRIQARRKAGA